MIGPYVVEGISGSVSTREAVALSTGAAVAWLLGRLHVAARSAAAVQTAIVDDIRRA